MDPDAARLCEKRSVGMHGSQGCTEVRVQSYRELAQLGAGAGPQPPLDNAFPGNS